MGLYVTDLAVERVNKLNAKEKKEHIDREHFSLITMNFLTK